MQCLGPLVSLRAAGLLGGGGTAPLLAGLAGTLDAVALVDLATAPLAALAALAALALRGVRTLAALLLATAFFTVGHLSSGHRSLMWYTAMAPVQIARAFIPGECKCYSHVCCFTYPGV